MLEVVEITYCHLITGHSAAGGQFTAQWTRIEKATQMETDLHRVKWGTTKWSRRIGEEQVGASRAGRGVNGPAMWTRRQVLWPRPVKPTFATSVPGTGDPASGS